MSNEHVVYAAAVTQVARLEQEMAAAMAEVERLKRELREMRGAAAAQWMDEGNTNAVRAIWLRVEEGLGKILGDGVWRWS